MTDDFEHEVNEWFDELEEQLAPAGRATSPDDASEEGELLRPILSHPSTLAPQRPAVRAAEEPPSALFEPAADEERLGLAAREAQLRQQKVELLQVEALVDVIRELVAEIRSVRRDVDQIKSVIGSLRHLIALKKREAPTPPTTIRTVQS